MTNCAQAWERISICFNGTWWMDGLGIELFNFPVDHPNIAKPISRLASRCPEQVALWQPSHWHNWWRPIFLPRRQLRRSHRCGRCCHTTRSIRVCSKPCTLSSICAWCALLLWQPRRLCCTANWQAAPFSISRNCRLRSICASP